MAESSVEAIWVNSAEGAEKTGYTPEHLSRLAKRIYQKPEAEREIKVKKRSYRYEMWLPDLVAYIENVGNGPLLRRNTAMIKATRQFDAAPEMIWVSAAKAAEITGYNRQYVTHLATRMYRKPEAEREIQVKKLGNRYEMWLPDLIAYIKTVRYGPAPKHNPVTT